MTGSGARDSTSHLRLGEEITHAAGTHDTNISTNSEPGTAMNGTPASTPTHAPEESYPRLKKGEGGRGKGGSGKPTIRMSNIILVEKSREDAHAAMGFGVEQTSAAKDIQSLTLECITQMRTTKWYLL